MIIALDFDGTLVREDDYADTAKPLRFLPGAKEALVALKRAGHTLVLWSARSNRALLYTPSWDPLVRAGVRKVNLARWRAERPVHQARYRQMLAFVEQELAGIIDAVDDGLQGKPTADLFIDNRALRYGFGADALGWRAIAALYGQPELAKEKAHA